ncbi:MAG: hypothetical protein ACOYXT_04945, partial [Bacteroidota bacterium]
AFGADQISPGNGKVVPEHRRLLKFKTCWRHSPKEDGDEVKKVLFKNGVFLRYFDVKLGILRSAPRRTNPLPMTTS